MPTDTPDLAALAERNHALTAAFHQESMPHRARTALLNLTAALPFPAGRGGANRLLVIRPDQVGDLVLTLPALELLRRARPDCEIHALVNERSADVLRAHPAVDRVLTTSFPGFGPPIGHGALAPYLHAIETARLLRRLHYDAALVLRPDHWWGALVAWLAGIPSRCGYDLDIMRQFMTLKLPLQHEHAVLQNIRLVCAYLDQPMPTQPVRLRWAAGLDDEAQADETLRRHGVGPQQPYVVIHAGAGAWSKLWAEERWSTVGSILSEQLDAAIVLTGGPAERETAGRIAMAMRTPAVNLAGSTDLPVLAEILRRAKLVLGADSGPLHMAVAVGTPSVALFGPADPAEFGPFGDPEHHRMVRSAMACAPCRVLDWSGDSAANHPCVRLITVQAVLEAAYAALASASGRATPGR